MSRIRVLVVDDAVVIRRMITEALGTDPDIEVAGVAANGKIALQKISQVNPDVLTLDLEMPEMDGISTLKELRKTYPRLPVIMFSTVTSRGAAGTLEALAAGATDYVTKPANVGGILEGIQRLREELIPKIKVHGRYALGLHPGVVSNPLSKANSSSVRLSAAPIRLATVSTPRVLAIGCSTGGPNALAEIFGGLRFRLPVPCVIVQHMPPLFTKMLAERLGKNSLNTFVEGEEGQKLEAGHVYVAPGGYHMELYRDGPPQNVRVRLNQEPPENSCRPAVDVLFRSVAHSYAEHVLALVLTGMGQDGLRGCRHIKERGGVVWIQDEATSVVWGMPGYVAQAGLAERILPLSQIAGEVDHQFRSSSRSTEGSL